MIYQIFLMITISLSLLSCEGAKKKGQTNEGTSLDSNQSDSTLGDPAQADAERAAARKEIDEAIRAALTEAKTAAEEAKGAKGGALDAAEQVKKIMADLGLNSGGERELPPAQTQTYCGKSQGLYDGAEIKGWAGAKEICKGACAHDLAVICTWDMLLVSLQFEIEVDRAHLWVADPDENCRGWTSSSTGDMGRTTRYLNNNDTSGADWKSQHIDELNRCSDRNFVACCGPKK